MSSPQHAPFLSHELLWEILSWLPVNSLMRFRCVCKSWNSLVFNPTFVKLHLQRSSPNFLFLCRFIHPTEHKRLVQCQSIESLFKDPSSTFHDVYNSIRNLVKEPSSTFHDLSLPASYEYGDIIGICNGLVCLSFRQGGFWPAKIQFWNPAMRLISQECCFNSNSIGESFTFVSTGFGYDNSRDTYKVVAVGFNLKSKETEVRVQCLGENCSRKVVNGTGFTTTLKSNKGLYLDGTLNWIAQFKKSNQCVIFSFDLRYETYRYLSFPSADFQTDICNVGLLRGCLSVFQHNYLTGVVSVWQMKEFRVAESWTLLLNVNCQCAQPSCLSQNGYHHFMYNQRVNTLDLFRIHAHVFLWNFFDYSQSLVLPY